MQAAARSEARAEQGTKVETTKKSPLLAMRTVAEDTRPPTNSPANMRESKEYFGRTRTTSAGSRRRRR